MKLICSVCQTFIQFWCSCAKWWNPVYNWCFISFFLYNTLNIHISRINRWISQCQICYIFSLFQFLYDPFGSFLIILIQNLSVLCHRRIQIQIFFFFHIIYHSCRNSVTDRMFPALRRHCYYRTFFYRTNSLIRHKFRITWTNSDSEQSSFHVISPPE